MTPADLLPAARLPPFPGVWSPSARPHTEPPALQDEGLR
jgi:hypothetical protein